jgi:hypothetical protein
MEPVTDKIRELEILKLCVSVLNASPLFYDNPNGAYEYTCPFCCHKECVGGDAYISLSDISHATDCAYLIAKDLTTNIL